MTVSRRLSPSALVAAAALAFHAVNGLAAALMDAFPASLDELQHLSFARFMEQRPSLLPDYDRMTVLAGAGGPFTAAPNYLNHPSPYYLLMGLVDRLGGGSILVLRMANLALSLAAVGVLLLAGFRLLKDWRERAVFAGALVLFPKLGAVAGLINNDNAALLAVGVCLLGLIEWRRAPSARSAAWLAGGLALCGWVKLTVLLMLVFGAGATEALRLWRSRKPASPLAYAILGAGLALAAIPSLANVAAYGRLLHHTSAHVVVPALRQHLEFGQYVGTFMRFMALKWAALEPTDPLQQLGLYLLLALAGLAVALGLRRAVDRELDEAPAWDIAVGLILATLPVLVIHLYFGWRTFQEDGFLEMAQMRYYYGVWPGFALGLALLWLRFPRPALRGAATSATAVLLASSSFIFWAGVMLLHGQTRIGY